MEMLFAAAGVFAILVAAEILWHTKVFRDEVARKFIHVGVGTFVAFWPYFLSWHQIEAMSLALLLGIAVSKHNGLFKSVHGVSRKTYGELLFPVGIGLSALIAPAPMIFTAAILHLSLADGFAALVGKYYGQRHQYKILQHTKSLAGTATFLLTSIIIVSGAVLLGGHTITWPLLPVLVCLPVAATILENLAIAGTDNLLVPLLIILVLQASSIF